MPADLAFETESLHAANLLSLVSVIVPCRNEIRHIRNFVTSVFEQEPGDFETEVLIADGMSTDGTRQALSDLKMKYPTLHTIDNPARIVSTGLNEAIRIAKGQIILRMDVHTDYATDYILRCVETLRASCADNVGGPTRTIGNGVTGRAIAAAYHARFASGGARFHDPTYEGYVDTVMYGCWWKSTLMKIGLFDESLVRNQDDELNLRIIRNGGRIWQSKSIKLWYRPRTDVRSLMKQYFQYGFWKVFVIRKHGKPASYRHLVPVACVLGSVALWLMATIFWISGNTLLFRVFAFTWVVLGCLYAGASLLCAVSAGRDSGWKVVAILPLVFGVYHLSYGFGFLLGLLSPKTAQKRWPRLSKFLTELTT